MLFHATYCNFENTKAVLCLVLVRWDALRKKSAVPNEAIIMFVLQQVARDVISSDSIIIINSSQITCLSILYHHVCVCDIIMNHNC